MKTLFEGNIAYRRFWFSAEAHCHVQVFRGESSSLVIATEIPENQGMSVTNACEHIATLMQQKYHLNPVSMVFVEHYQPIRKAETFDKVTFTWKRLDKPTLYEASHPQWKRISSQGLEDIKVHLDDLPVDSIDETPDVKTDPRDFIS